MVVMPLGRKIDEVVWCRMECGRQSINSPDEGFNRWASRFGENAIAVLGRKRSPKTRGDALDSCWIIDEPGLIARQTALGCVKKCMQ